MAKSSTRQPEAGIVKLFAIFAVAFKQIGVFLPIIAAAMTLLFYFFYPTSWPREFGGLLILTVGLIGAFLIALVYALCNIPIAALTNRGLQDYAFLKMTEVKLRARLGNPVLENGIVAIPGEERTEWIDFPSLKQDCQKLAVYREACNTYFKLKENLYSPKAGQLLSNVGDVYALAMANRTQEALIKIETKPGVIDEAKQVYAAIQASSMNNRDELLKELAQAISVLDPQAAEGLLEDKSDKQFDSLRKEIQELRNSLEVKTDISNHSPSPAEEEQMRDRENTANSQPASEPEIRIRATICAISSRLHEFQENRLAGVLQARNNLVLSIFASGLITYALVCVSIIAILQYLPSDTSYKIELAHVTYALASAVVIYTTGVAAGLFGRLYAEANKESAAKDYGLSRVRLQAIPLISGLAAIGGVFITTTTLAATNESAALLSAFTLNARNILVAMIFGFTPNLLIRGFQRYSDQYTSDLESKKVK